MPQTDIAPAATVLCLDHHDEEPWLMAFPGGTVAVYSRRSPLKEAINEDAAALIVFNEQSGLLAVADGCGGMSRGEQASKVVVRSLEESIRKSQTADSGLRPAILDGIETANSKLCEMGIGAATTLAAVEISGREIRTFHAGDSQSLLVGNRGKIKLQTVSHSPVGYAVEAGMLSADEAIHHDDRHYVSNVIGTAELHIEVRPTQSMSAYDTLLLASDGVLDNLQIDEVIEIIRKGPLKKAANALAKLTLQRMESPQDGSPSKPDDATFILYRAKR